MAFSKDFAAYVQELLGGLGPIRVKPMFGAAGVYVDDLMFAIISDDSLYLRVDPEIEDRFAAEGSTPFVYKARDGQEMQLGYWSAPEAALEDPDEAQAWARLSLEAAMRKKAPKGKKTPLILAPAGRGRGPPA